MATSKKTAGKSSSAKKQQQPNAGQQMAELKKKFQIDLKAAQATAFDKGFKEAVKRIGQVAKTGTKDILKAVQTFEKALGQIEKTQAKQAPKAKKAKKTVATEVNDNVRD